MVSVVQADLFASQGQTAQNSVQPFSLQLLKWIGNKQRYAHEIVSYFPPSYGTYYEPFLGSGAVLGTLAPKRAIASDVLPPLMGIWLTLASEPQRLLRWYRSRWEAYQRAPTRTYERIRARFSRKPNPADLLFLARACYGGVVRFRKDGHMSTPPGVHSPISPESFARRIEVWRERVRGTVFRCCDFEEAIAEARAGDLIYCDPPYHDTQTILYGAQAFDLERLFAAIERAKARGVFVALSLDGTKKSGRKLVALPTPPQGLFERAAFVHCGRSMLRRFQVGGASVADEVVSDRLFLTWS